MGTIYPYITGIGFYFNLYWEQLVWSYLLITTYSVNFINLYMFRSSV